MENYLSVSAFIMFVIIVIYIRVIKKHPLVIANTIQLLTAVSGLFYGVYWIAECLVKQFTHQSTYAGIINPNFVGGITLIWICGAAIKKIINLGKSELPAPSRHIDDEDGRKR